MTLRLAATLLLAAEAGALSLGAQYNRRAALQLSSSLAATSFSLIAPSAVFADEVTTTASGLKYIEVKEGTGLQPKAGQTVSVHYTGWLDDFDSEKKFDSSYDRRKPLQFAVGTGRVIKGWDEGLLGMKVGGKRRLIIPSELGYGTKGAGGIIPPGATLYFDVELLAVL
ncbi:hypothetical protein AB1Y20_013200 [Prymnesium parvum]|uniref:peptidylprolyl isomerase n=1 Tax=Prymnesium parvum TaxID=97485 RepID=A0AB34IKX6_PRYPA